MSVDIYDARCVVVGTSLSSNRFMRWISVKCGEILVSDLRGPCGSWVILEDKKGVRIDADWAALEQVSPLPKFFEVAVRVALGFPLLKLLVKPAREGEEGRRGAVSCSSLQEETREREWGGGVEGGESKGCWEGAWGSATLDHHS